MSIKKSFVFFGLLFVLGVTSVFADDPPAWMRQAASASVPGYDKDVPAVVLHDEQIVSLNSDGKLTTTENYAVKMLTREGRSCLRFRWLVRDHPIVDRGCSRP